MIGRLLCLAGLHRWEHPWEVHTSAGLLYETRCRRCGRPSSWYA